MSINGPVPRNLISSTVFDAKEIILDIRGGEGGQDSKLFVSDLLAAYIKYAVRKGLKCELLTSEIGHATVKIIGHGAGKAFQYEQGKHCVQRIPPTEHKGRKQTSIVSVAVLPIPPDNKTQPLPEKDLDIKTQCGHGPGGQHQNKTASAVRITHTPTGLQVFINGRDQHSNKRDALRIITAKVNEHYQEKQEQAYNQNRKAAVGNGSRGEKVRTYNFMESRAVDHRFNTKTRDMKGLMKGNFELLMPETTK